MTGTALTRPGQRERLPVKLAEIDWRLVGLLCLVAGVGAMMLYSLGGTSWEPWAANHVLRVGVCVVIMLVLSLVNLRIWFATAYPIYFAALVLLVAVELFGYTVNNAKSWLDLGVTRIQPSELMKIGVVLALARWYHGASAQDARLSWKLIIPAAIIGVPVLLVADQPDLGTAMLIAMTGGAMMFMAGLSWRLVAAAAAAAAVAIPLFVQFVLHEYQRQRVLTFLTPEADPSGSGYHIMQSKIAMGSGGFLGKGFGLGSQSSWSSCPKSRPTSSSPPWPRSSASSGRSACC